MGTQAKATTTPPNLHTLPDDVVLQLLDHLTPTEMAAFSHISHQALQTVSDPTVWASAARRHLAIAPSHPQALTPQVVYELACKLVCHWWLVTGAFIAGVPVHRRSGFTSVCPRGGIEVPVLPDASETCYVFGGRYANRSIPASIPSVVLDFPLDPAGPFPVDGMRLRLVHAAEPADPARPYSSHLNDDSEQPHRNHTAEVAEDFKDAEDAEEPFVQSMEAHITITLNSHPIKTVVCKPTNTFTQFHVNLPSNLLVTKPVLNTLAIEYHRDSTAGYWLRDVTLTPVIVPLPPLPAATLEFPLAMSLKPLQGYPGVLTPPPLLQLPAPGLQAFHPSPLPSPSQSPPRSPNSSPSPNSGRNSPRSTRDDSSPARSSRRPLDVSPSHLVTGLEAPGSPRHTRSGKSPKSAKRPKHVYHKQNHHRSTRASHGTGRARSHR